MNSSFFLEYVMHIKLISNVLMQCQAGNGMRTGKKKKKRNWSSCQAFGNKMGSYSLWIVGKSSYIDICTKPGLAKPCLWRCHLLRRYLSCLASNQDGHCTPTVEKDMYQNVKRFV